MEQGPKREMDVYAHVTLAGNLDIGEGSIGVEGRPTSHEEIELFGHDLADVTTEVSAQHETTAFCIEDRKWLSVACVSDPTELDGLAFNQVVGGITLTTLFALVAVNSDVLSDGSNLNQKGIITASWLSALGFKNFIHDDCGALKGFSGIGNNLVSADVAAGELAGFGTVTAEDRQGLELIVNNLTEATQSSGTPDSFIDFDSESFAKHIKDEYPEYVTTVETDPSDSHGGHKGSALYLPASGMGLVKNRLIKEKDRHAFAFTPKFAEILAKSLSAGDMDEAHLIELAVKYHLLVTGNALFARYMPAYTGVEPQLVGISG